MRHATLKHTINPFRSVGIFYRILNRTEELNLTWQISTVQVQPSFLCFWELTLRRDDSSKNLIPYAILTLRWFTESSKSWLERTSDGCVIQPLVEAGLSPTLIQMSCGFAQLNLENIQGWSFYHPSVLHYLPTGISFPLKLNLNLLNL